MSSTFAELECVGVGLCFCEGDFEGSEYEVELRYSEVYIFVWIFHVLSIIFIIVHTIFTISRLQHTVFILTDRNS